jgi:integrase
LAWRSSLAALGRQTGRISGDTSARSPHALRHHFISALAQTQTPDANLQAIGGHLSRKMLDHYGRATAEAKRRAEEQLDAGKKFPVE